VTVRLVERSDEVSLRIGMTASVEIQVREVEGELVVPSSALLRRGGDEVVHVVRDGVAHRVEVAVLALGDGTAAVSGDLAVGDIVVTTGVELLEDGQEVTLAPDDQAAEPLDPAGAARR
jgi:multidrug efflux pump subunit AcrA (membrane-fusion protein)